MSVYNECDYCGKHYRPEHGLHVCEVSDLQGVIDSLREEVDELEERIADAGERLMGEDA